MERILRDLLHPCRAASYLLETAKQLFPQSDPRILADAANFWNQSNSGSPLADHSHWLGEGRWSDETAWTQIGKVHFGMFEKLCLLSGTARPIQSMVEWGSGGGANAVQFCSEVRHFCGVDISEVNLAECQRHLEALNFKGFHPILIDIRHPEQSLALVKSKVDFFLSTAVYQHFPSKEYGIQVTKLAHQLLTDNGVALIQIRYDDGSERFRPKRRDYQKNMTTFTSYGIAEFWKIVCQIGFKPLAITLEPGVNYAYFYLQKRAAET